MKVQDPERLAAVDLNLVPALDALLTERSVTEAATRLSIHQPAMSASLSRLRRLFNDPLFVREGSRLVPTPFADNLATPVADALASVMAIRDGRTAFVPATDHRALSVIASDYVTVVLLQPVLEQLREVAPHVRIDVRSVSPRFDHQLRRGRADLAIVPRSVAGSPAGLDSRDLFTDRNVFAVDASRQDVGGRFSRDELASHPLVTYQGGHLGTVSLSDLGRPPANRGLDLTTQSFLVAAFMLAGTRTAALMPERLVSRLAQPAGIRPVEPPTDLPPFSEAMYWSQARRNDPALLWMRDQLTRASLQLLSGSPR